MTRVFIPIAAFVVGLAMLVITLDENYLGDDDDSPVRLVVQARAEGPRSAEGFEDRLSTRRGDRVTVRGRVTNVGGRTATGVTLAASLPHDHFAEYVRGSCRLRTPRDERPQPCDKAFDDAEVAIGRLEEDEAAVLEYEMVARRPPCVPYRSAARFTAGSDQTTEDGDRVALAAIDDATGDAGVPGCTSQAGRLRKHLPIEFRHRCRRTDYVEGSPRAAVLCPRPAPGVVNAVYELFPTRAATRRTYARRRSVVVRSRRSCGGFAAESDYPADGEQGAGRRLCWVDHRGRAWIEWTDLRYRIYAHAHRRDGGINRLHRWWHEESGPWAAR